MGCPWGGTRLVMRAFVLTISADEACANVMGTAAEADANGEVSGVSKLFV